MNKRIFVVVIFVFIFKSAFSQDTVEIKNRLTDSVIEKYHVLKTNPKVKVGLYQALFRRRVIVASGIFSDGKKTGLWHFYDTDGKLIENYNYDTKQLREAPEDTSSDLRYVVDRKIKSTDTTTKPIKIGGRYFGYLPYLMAFKFPSDYTEVNTNLFDAKIELLVTPLGRLADYKVHVVSRYYQYDRTTTMSLNLFNEEDRTFIPATINKEPVLSRIIIKCYITPDGEINFN